MNDTIECRATPEPTTVMIDWQMCPKHNCRLVSMPRNEGEVTLYAAKCPWKNCREGRKVTEQ
jgi:hypothetical protein